jgi:hypothetical protein
MEHVKETNNPAGSVRKFVSMACNSVTENPKLITIILALFRYVAIICLQQMRSSLQKKTYFSKKFGNYSGRTVVFVS